MSSPSKLLLLDIKSRSMACAYPRSHTNASITDDGLCFVQPVLKEGAVSGRASGTEIGEAAATMLQACVVERGMGGIAFNIGECRKIRQP